MPSQDRRRKNVIKILTKVIGGSKFEGHDVESSSMSVGRKGRS
jgi:hypothetical protein